MATKKELAVFGVKYYPSQGGTSRVAESITKELRHKYNITVYCYKNELAKDYLDQVKVIMFPKLPFGAAGVFVYYFLCCVHILLTKSYDIIHVHKTDAAFFIPFLQWRGKVIATSHEAPYIRDKWSAVGKRYFRLMEKMFVKSSAMLTSVSKPLADYYNKTYGSNVRYVPNGVELSDERDFDAAQAILDEFNVEGPYILFAARRIMSTKGCHTFLKAMQQVQYKGTIIIAGEAMHASAYMKEIERLSEGLNVKMVGFVKGIPKLMALIEKADLFIFPSEIEGLSIMLLEVGSTGVTPLICSDIPENTQVFTDEHILFFENKNVEDLAEKFEWAVAHPEEMKQKALAARQHVIDQYSSQALAMKYDALFQELAA